jgi:hypothetical protein
MFDVRLFSWPSVPQGGKKTLHPGPRLGDFSFSGVVSPMETRATIFPAANPIYA